MTSLIIWIAKMYLEANNALHGTKLEMPLKRQQGYAFI